MAYFLMAMFFGSFITRLNKNILKESVYLVQTLVEGLCYFKATIWVFCEKWIVICTSRTFNAAIYTTKVLDFLFNEILANCVL